MTEQDYGSQPTEQTVPLEYVEQPGLGGLAIKNFLLSVITLGIYGFWGRTNVRRHIWSSVRIMDEPLEYTGTGMELFLGALIVSLVVILPFTVALVAVGIAFPNDPVAELTANLVFAVIVLFLIGIAIYRARRYRLSRTLWKGIRGTLTGSPTRYAWSNFWMTLTLPFTLLWSYPWMRTRLNSRITNEMEFGNTPFGFDGRSRALYPRFAIVWICGLASFAVLYGLIAVAGMSAFFTAFTQLDPMENANLIYFVMLAAIFVLIVLPLISLMMAVFRAIYVAGELNYFAQCTSFDTVRFRMNATAGSLIELVVVNFFILLFTLGIGRPFVQQRLVRYICQRMSIEGTIDVDKIRQSQARLDKRGEGLAEAFDIDAF